MATLTPDLGRNSASSEAGCGLRESLVGTTESRRWHPSTEGWKLPQPGAVTSTEIQALETVGAPPTPPPKCGKYVEWELRDSRGGRARVTL